VCMTSGALGITIDFQTFTSAFSNCGMRWLVPDCGCGAAAPAKTITAARRRRSVRIGMRNHTTPGVDERRSNDCSRDYLARLPDDPCSARAGISGSGSRLKSLKAARGRAAVTETSGDDL